MLRGFLRAKHLVHFDAVHDTALLLFRASPSVFVLLLTEMCLPFLYALKSPTSEVEKTAVSTC